MSFNAGFLRDLAVDLVATEVAVAEDAVGIVDVAVTGAVGAVADVVALLALVPSHNLEVRRSPLTNACKPSCFHDLTLCFPRLIYESHVHIAAWRCLFLDFPIVHYAEGR